MNSPILFEKLSIYSKINKDEKKVSITQEDFDAYTLEEKVSCIDSVRQMLGDSEFAITIGNKLFKDREELQLWKIEKGYMKM